jgi:tetratricopeptide (TPR) repeat protein
MKKYRIKLRSGRVVGPFALKQVGELFLNGHIDGEEDVQIFPSGDWSPLISFPELTKLFADLAINSSALEKLEANHTVINFALSEQIKKIKEEREQKKQSEDIEKIRGIDEAVKKEEFQEFKFDRKSKTTVNYEELERNYEQKKEDEKRESPVEPVPVETPKPQLEATRVLNKNDLLGVDKTVVVPREDIEKEEVEIASSEDIEAPSEEMAVDLFDSNEKTSMANIEDLYPEIREDSLKAEEDFEREENRLRIDLEKEKGKSNLKSAEFVGEEEEKAPTKKKMKPIVAIAFAALFYFLFFDSEEVSDEISPIVPAISAPITLERENQERSLISYQKGLDYYSKGTYPSRILAANEFRISLENKFEDNQALGLLILSYAELLPDIADKERASGVLFQLSQIAQAKALKDLNTAIGVATFYLNLGKYESAITTLENYLRLGKPSLKLLSVYLDALISAGELDRSRQILLKVIDAEPKPPELILAIERFYELDERYDEGLKTINEGLKIYPSSVGILLEFAKYQLRANNYQKLSEVLTLIKNLKAEQSPRYYSRFLEYMGMLSISNKDNQTAAILFRKALELRESDELRSKLAALELGGSRIEEALILESKIIDMMRKAKKSVKSEDWDSAFRYSIEAADLSASYIPAQLLLADIQIKRGFFESSISTLARLKKEYPLNTRISVKLVEAYISAKKFDDAQLELNGLNSTGQVSQTAEYSSLLGRFYLESGKYLQAIQFLQESVARNPLNDKDYYLLAKTYLNHRRYPQAKMMLTKAMTLDPQNLEYISSFSKILYELDGAETAIGYLRKFMEDGRFDNPRLLGDIATFYYKNGQLKEFEEYKERVEKMAKRDPSFYEFLISTSKLEERTDNVIRYSNELLKVEPGNIDVRILLGNSYVSVGKYKEAIEIFESVRERLISYPRIHYYIGLVYLKIAQSQSQLQPNDKNLARALEYGKTEIERNPTLFNGYYLAGEGHRLKGEYPEAVKMLEKAISLEGKSVDALMALGWIRARQNYYESARELYLRAVRTAPNNPEIRKALGQIYEGIGQGALAIEEYGTYLKLNPGASDRAQIEQRINLLSR